MEVTFKLLWCNMICHKTAVTAVLSIMQQSWHNIIAHLEFSVLFERKNISKCKHIYMSACHICEFHDSACHCNVYVNKCNNATIGHYSFTLLYIVIPIIARYKISNLAFYYLKVKWNIMSKNYPKCGDYGNNL